MLLPAEIKAKANHTEDEYPNVSQIWYLLLFWRMKDEALLKIVEGFLLNFGFGLPSFIHVRALYVFNDSAIPNFRAIKAKQQLFNVARRI